MIKSILDIGYFKLARNISKQSDYHIKVGAVICKKKPINAACNIIKTHPVHTNKFTKAIHAEVRAILTCSVGDLSGATIYVYRERKDGTIGISRPCNRCYNFIKEKGIKKIYYTINEYPYYRIEKI